MAEGDTDITVSVVFQMEPMRGGNVQDMAVYAEQLTSYLVHNLKKFASEQGYGDDTDMVVAVSAERSKPRDDAGFSNKGSYSYHSGRYVKELALKEEDST